MPPPHLSPIPDVEPHQEKVGGTGQQFDSLHGVKPGIELADLRLGAEKKRGRNQHQQAVCADGRQAATFGDRRREGALSPQNDASGSGNYHARNERDECVGDSDLDTGHSALAQEQLGNDCGQPEGRDEKEGQNTCGGVDLTFHRGLLELACHEAW